MKSYKHLYEQTNLMLEKYQDEVVPRLRVQLEHVKRERDAAKFWLKRYRDVAEKGELVHVVRCKDCQNSEDVTEELKAGELYRCKTTKIVYKPSHFCAIGWPKSGELGEQKEE